MHNQLRELQPYEDCQAKSIQEFGWTLQGMDWGWGQGIKSHHTQMCQGIWLKLSVGGVLPGLRRLSGAKSSFQMIARFCISFGNQGPRVWRKGGEAHSPSCLTSSIMFPQSVIIWGAMSSADVGPLLFFFENQRHCTHLSRYFGALHASFCWLAF